MHCAANTSPQIAVRPGWQGRVDGEENDSSAPSLPSASLKQTVVTGQGGRVQPRGPEMRATNQSRARRPHLAAPTPALDVEI